MSKQIDRVNRGRGGVQPSSEKLRMGTPLVRNRILRRREAAAGSRVGRGGEVAAGPVRRDAPSRSNPGRLKVGPWCALFVVLAWSVSDTRVGGVDFLRGDATADAEIDLSDPIRILGWLFLGTEAPECLDAADASDDGEVAIDDPISLLEWLFLDGPPPGRPGPTECGPDPTEDLLGCNSYPPCRGNDSRSRKVFRNADGSVNGMLERDGMLELFRIPPRAIELDAFKRWIVANTASLALEPIADVLVLDGLRPARRPISVFGDIRALHFEQTYRDFEVLGPESRVSLSVVGSSVNARAVAFTGTILDPRPEYAGLMGRRLPPETATERILDAWLTLSLEVGPQPARGDSIGKVGLVAVPSRRALAYRGEIMRAGQIVAAVVVHSVSGERIGYDQFRYNDAFDHHPISVQAFLMAENPDTTAVGTYSGLRGSSFGACTPPPPAGTGCILRMGDDRAAIYDFEEDNTTSPTVWLTTQFQPNYSQFAAVVPSAQFKTQNAYHKMHAALDAIDPLKSVYGWDHNPAAPFGVSTPAPLSMWTNIDSIPEGDPCGDGLGKFYEYYFDAQWNALEHPYVTNQFPTAVAAICQENESTLFHEIGHYYDMYTTHGVMGTGLMTSSCIWDTPDESLPLRETVADVVMLYLYRKLYPQLPHTLATTDNPCNFVSLGASISVQSGNCPSEGQSVAQFDNDRPASHPSSSCSITAGYRISAIWQAMWKSFNGMFCNTFAPFDCAFLFPFESESIMEGILYSFSLSNLQSYEQFFENVWYYVDYQLGAATGNMFRRNMVNHGILEEL